MSWIISSIWLWDLWKYHRDPKPKVSFDKDKENTVSLAATQDIEMKNNENTGDPDPTST